MNTATYIINVDTACYTALAALSAKRHLPFDLRIIDCSRLPEQRLICKRIASELNCSYEKWPLKTHGRTLDDLFRSCAEDWIVLLDSDAEILDPSVFLNGLSKAQSADYYSVGWIQQTAPAIEAGSPITLYMERPWLPFAAFSASAVRELIESGSSFDARRIDNDLLWLPPLLRRPLSFRRHIPVFRSLRLKKLQTRQRSLSGITSPYYYFDTAAELHRDAIQASQSFECLDWTQHDSSVFHVHGGTRRTLRTFMLNSDHSKAAVRRAFSRILELYTDILSKPLVNQIRTASLL